jgi:TPR repeat protein
MSLQGRGVEQDDAEAANWYRKAAEQGHITAQNNLGVMYERGLGVEQDYAEAASWYRKAAEQGNTDAIKALERLATRR